MSVSCSCQLPSPNLADSLHSADLLVGRKLLVAGHCLSAYDSTWLDEFLHLIAQRTVGSLGNFDNTPRWEQDRSPARPTAARPLTVCYVSNRGVPTETRVPPPVSRKRAEKPR